MCHSDATLTTVRYGQTVSMYVNSQILAASVHKNQKCISCHKDANVKDFPHPEVLAPVDCGSCHANYQKLVDNDVHHKLLNLSVVKAPTCKLCHGKHDVQSPSTIADKEKSICGKCHTVNKLSAPYHTVAMVNDNCLKCHKKKDYKGLLAKSVHSKLACSNCHGYVAKNLASHKKVPEGTAVTDCYLCHAEIAQEHKKSIHGLSLTSGVYEAAQCWDCHGTHSIYRVKNDSSKVSPKNLAKTCGSCHDDSLMARKYSFTVKQPGKMYTQSVHGKLVMAGSKLAPTCVTCHGKHNIKNRVQEGSPISSIAIPDSCGKCHAKQAKEYKESIHWIAVQKGVREAPSCNDCHGEHNISAINTLTKREEIRKLQETTCLQCHQNLLLSERYGIEGKNASSYLDSYHGLAVTRGDTNAAMCIDCHNVHKILPKYHKESSINPNNITATCQKCHKEATDVFAKSYSHVTEKNSTAGKVEGIVTSIYIWLIIFAIGFMLIHNLIILIYDLQERYKHANKEIRIPRLTRNELVQHIVLLVSFIILAATGFQLKYPTSWWSQNLQYLGLNEFVRHWVHRGSAIVMIVLAFYHVVYLLITPRGRDVIKGLLPKISDFKMAWNNMLFFLRIKKKHPDFDNYSYMEKIEYWALIWGTLIMGITGLVLWFPTMVGNWAPVWFIKVSEIIHFYEAVLATLAIIIWHLFFVMFRPDEYPISFTSVNGTMTFVQYKKEHKLKFKKVVNEWSAMKAGTRTEKQLSHYTKLFIATIRKSGVDVDEFFRTEIEKDETLLDIEK